MPIVSVIIPVYNVAPYLRQCLDSVVNQTLHDIEIICVDDGSTDGSAAVLAEYAAKDARITVIRHAHENAGAARNAALAVAKGAYIGFVDADDFCDVTLFEKAYGEACRADADVVSIRFRQYNTALDRFESEHLFSRAILALPRPFAPAELGEFLFAPLSHGPWARLVRRAFIEREKLRFQSVVRMNDVFFCCLSLATAKRISLVDEALYFYRKEHGSNLQSGNVETPLLAFEIWRTVADGLAGRNLLEPFRRAFCSASAGTFFYVLGAMPDLDSASSFYRHLRNLYAADALFASVDADDVAFPQTLGYFKMLKACEDFSTFQFQQGDYLRKRVSRDAWARAAAERKLEETQSRALQIGRCCEALRADLAAHKAKEATIWAERVKFKEERDALRGKVEEQKEKEAAIWAERVKFKEERDALRGKVKEQKEKEAVLWAARCKFLDERNALRKIVAGKDATIAADAVSIAELRNNLATAQTEMAALQASFSYKLGRALTKPFRFVRRSLKMERK